MKKNYRFGLWIVMLLFITNFGCQKDKIPVLSTNVVTIITATSAISGGTITDEGSGTIIVRGICWSTEITPTIKDNKTSDGAGAGNFTSSIIGLLGGTIYYVRAYATNSSGTGYGMAMSFKTLGLPPRAPTVNTLDASNLQVTTATLNGSVNANYLSSSVTFEYGLTTTYGNAVLAIQSPVTGNLNTSVSANISSLTIGTTYHYRANSVNSLGTTFGEDKIFSTLGQSPTATTNPATNKSTNSATVNGTVNANYLSTIVTFEYGITTTYGQSTAATPSPVSGSTNTNVSASINALSPNTTYHYRVKTVNSLGTNYGNDVEFTTLGQPPSSITQAASSIQLNTANLFGTINANYLSTTVTFEYGNTESYGSIVTAIPSLVSGNSNTSVEATITGLTPGTTYYFRVNAVNSLGTTYGVSKTFTTLSGVATLTTTTIGSITATTAISGGNITYDGGAPITAKGVCWNTSTNPTISDNKTSNGTGTGSFVSSINGLQENATYFVRAYATNSVTTSYGSQESFTTKNGIVTISTTAISQLTATTTVCGGNIPDDGGSPVAARGVCWNTLTNPTISDNKTSNGTGTGSFVSSINGLQENTTYFVRAYASNAFGTHYGTELIFKTLYSGQFADLDGNVYNTVSIGTQTWMTENLKTTKYNDGTTIPMVTDNTEWNNSVTPGYCWYNNNETGFKATYGALYNWYTVNTGKLCSTGWHVSTYAEWTTLTTYLGGASGAGSKLKESGTTRWTTPNTGATNETGFTALPGGGRGNVLDSFYYIGLAGYWWSSTEYDRDYAMHQYMGYDFSNVMMAPFSKRSGFSVRCVKD